MPVSRLPHEILSIIFAFTASLNRVDDIFLLKSGDDSKPRIYDPQNQINISHVCRKWRSVALTSPGLWNTIHFEKYCDVERGRVFCNRLLANTPMDILILTVSKVEYEESSDHLIWKEEMDEIFKILSPRTPNWRAFHLQVRDGTCKAIARQYIGTQNGELCGPAPNLETWQLYHFEDFRNVEDLREATYRKPVKCFEDYIPKLKHLSLIGVNLPWHSPYLKQPLDTLELCLHPNNIRPPYPQWRDMLASSPNLRSLFLHYSGPQFSTEDPEWPTEVVPLSKLETLGLVDLEPDHLEAITSRIDTPNIQSLEIELSGDDSEEPVGYDSWLRSLSAPTPSPKFQSLTSLTITALQCTDPDTSLKMFLGTLVKLRELEMKYDVWSSIWGVFVQDLQLARPGPEDGVVEVSPSPFLLPTLEVIKVRGTKFADARANVKMILRLREREGASGRQQSPSVGVDEDRSFAIVGTLPVHVIPPKGNAPDLSERSRLTRVLKRLVGLMAEEEESQGEEDPTKSWRVFLDIHITEDDDDVEDEEDVDGEEDLDDTEELEEVYVDDDEVVDYSDEDS